MNKHSEAVGDNSSESMCSCHCVRMATSLDDLKSALFWRGVIAECLGTMFLTLIGCGSCIGWDDSYSPTIVQIALCFGLSVATVVWCIGSVSGGHINPAVTTAMLVTRHISVVRGVLFIFAQCAGAAAGSGILMGLTPAKYRGLLGATLVNPELSVGQGFGVEFMITFVLVLTVFAACDSKRKDLNGSAPLSIGLSVTVCHLWAIKFTGSSMNSARSFGPAVVQGLWQHHWVYWCGPILGGIAAGMIYENLLASNASMDKARGYLLASRYDPEDYEENDEKPSKVIMDDMEESV